MPICCEGVQGAALNSLPYSKQFGQPQEKLPFKPRNFQIETGCLNPVLTHLEAAVVWDWTLAMARSGGSRPGKGVPNQGCKRPYQFVLELGCFDHCSN